MWGLLTDKYGRKPCLLSGLAGSGLAMLMFGLSSSYIMAVVSHTC
jgi:MFS family permease